MAWTRRALLRGTAAAGLALAGLTSAQPGFALEIGKRGGTLTVGLPYDQDTLNVFSTGFLPDAASAVVEGLIAPDQDAKYFPVLATEVPTLANGGIKVLQTARK